MWKCSACGETVDNEFDICWNCQQTKPPSPTLVSETSEPSPLWADNFRRTKRPDGCVEVEAFGRRLTCGVCGKATFRERTPSLTFGWSKVATSFICSRCGYVFWFVPQ